MTDPLLGRPDEFRNDPVGLAQNRDLARRTAFEHLNRPSSDIGAGIGFVLLVFPWLMVMASVFVLATWFSAHADVLRDVLESSPLGSSIAQVPDGEAGEPVLVSSVIASGVAIVVIGVTLARGWYWRRWFDVGGTARSLRTVLWATTVLRSVVVVVGLALAGTAGGIARGADLDPAVRAEAVAGWWPWFIVAVSCILISVGSVRRVRNRVLRRIAAALDADASTGRPAAF
jgi:hypothetical protein